MTATTEARNIVRINFPDARAVRKRKLVCIVTGKNKSKLQLSQMWADRGDAWWDAARRIVKLSGEQR